MSQTAQANNLHDEGAQLFEEARRRLDNLNAKNKAGELSAEAFAAEEKAVDEALDAAEKFMKRAKKLSAIKNGADELSAMAPTRVDGRPEYLRPMGEGSGTQQLAGASSEHMPLVNGSPLGDEQRLCAARMAGMVPSEFTFLSSHTRGLMNQLIRSQVPGCSVPAPRREDVEFLKSHGAGHRPVREHLNVSPYIDRDGGMITAHEVGNEVIAQIRNARHIRQRAKVIRTNAATLAFPTEKVVVPLKKTRAHKGKIDGSGAVSIREVIGKTEFNPSGQMEIIKVPEELIEDANFDLVGFIATQIAEQAYDDDENAFLTGSGVGEPYGVLTAPILGVPHTGAGAVDFKPEDVKTLPFEIRDALLDGAIWMANRTFLKKVAVMRTEEGGANTGEFLFQNGLRAGDPPTLVGYTVARSEFFPDYVTSGSAGDPLCLFGNWMHYWIVERLSMEIRILAELYAEEQHVGWRFRRRLDAAPTRLEPWVTLDRK